MPKDLRVTGTTISGVFLVELPVYRDNRGWFKENWRRDKMVAQGLPDFEPVQNNISFNENAGTTRGIHAEPWDKFISVATGRIFGAWVDLREGQSFGAVLTAELGPGQAIFLPSGVGNSYQTLEDRTAYTYLVDAHWSADAEYTFLNLADASVNIEWPIPLDQVELSDKDRAHPGLEAVTPIQHGVTRATARRGAGASKKTATASPYDVAPVPQDMNTSRTLILGANTPLGRALVDAIPTATAGDWDWNECRSRLPFAHDDDYWAGFDTVVNVAPYARLVEDWNQKSHQLTSRANDLALMEVAKVAIANGLTLVHISPGDPFEYHCSATSTDQPDSSPEVGVRAAVTDDTVVAVVPRHYIVHVGSLIGEERGFATPVHLPDCRGVGWCVGSGQVNELAYTEAMADGVIQLLEHGSDYGSYQLCVRTTGSDPKAVAGLRDSGCRAV